MSTESVITRTVRVAGGVFAPGHLGELTQVIDFELVDAVLAETGTRQRRTRLLPARVVVYFVLALALFERCSYRGVWAKLTTGLAGLVLTVPSASSLSRARRRVGTAPLRRLFETLAGPLACPGQTGAFYRGLRTVALDGTCLHVPDDPQITSRYPKRFGDQRFGDQRFGDQREFGYPLLQLLVLIECGTRAVMGAAFGPDTTGELGYAHRLLGALDPTMLLLADAYYDAVGFLNAVQARGAQWLVRSSARRCPTPQRHLPDGSYLALLGYGKLAPLLQVRVIEATLTLTLADGTVRHERWRLLTSLLDHTRHPAHELVALYHERWQVETTYFSIKATILDGRVLRSRSTAGLDQEVYALLTVYQALIRAAADTITVTGPGLDMDRISFTILLNTAADLVTTASGIQPTEPIDLAGAIGRAALHNLLPARRRPRIKARTRKNPTSKYGPNAGRHPATTQTYTLHTEIAFLENGLAPRPRR